MQPNLEISTNEIPTSRDNYEQRKVGAERFFLENPPRQDIVESDGGRTMVLSQTWVVPEELKNSSSPERDITKIALYVPGMFEAKDPNLGNHPLENKLLGSLFYGDTDAYVVLKAEGMNDLAYKSDSGEAYCESHVAGAAVSILKSQIEELKKKFGDKRIEFTIAGYSEGASQGASIVQKILEENLGTVSSYTSIGGGGLVGYEKQKDADILRFIQVAMSRIKKLQPKKLWEQEGQDTFLIDKVLMGDEKRGGYEYSLGKASVSQAGDMKNVGLWTLRYASSLLGLGGNVPSERVKAVCTVNHDYEKIVERGVPLLVLSGSEEIFFPSDFVEEQVKKLREKGGKVLLIKSNIGHDFPHNHPSGVAYALEAFKRKVGIR